MHEQGRSATTRRPPAAAVRPPRVVVMSEQQLMRDTVRTALHRLRFATTSMSMPVTAYEIAEVRHRLAPLRPAAGVLICDVRGVASLHRAAAVLTGLGLEWVVLANAPPGLVWGALIDAGATTVLEASARPQELAQTLNSVAAKRVAPAGGRHEQVMRAWRGLTVRQRRVIRCLEELSPREMEILVALYAGDPVQVIARRCRV
jgi:DNA-binding NarL/FixJ family response regulator